jgi:hypothetical protein
MGFSTQSDFLFTNPSFWVGVGGAVNLAGNYFPFNASPTAEIADMRAMQADFAVVGEDLRRSMELYEQKVAESETTSRN